MTKKCSKCKIKQSEEKFYKNKSTKDGLQSQCKSCSKKHREKPEIKKRILENTKKYKKTFEGKKSQRKYELKIKYNITIEDYNSMFEAQNGRCKICGIKNHEFDIDKNLSVDHDHETKKVRGLLCINCNTNLGWFEENRDNILKYLPFRSEK